MIQQASFLLSLTIFLPLIGIFFILMIRGEQETVARNVRFVALWTSIVTFALSLFLWISFDPLALEFQFVQKLDWIPFFKTSYHVGLDGISLFFVLLSTFLTPLCILASWKSVKKYVREYMIAFLLLETMMVGMFASLDTVLFYLFFEGVLIPMFLIIGVWGGERRIYAAFKFFLYTLLGSLLMLLAIVMIYFEAGTTDIPTLMQQTLPADLQKYLWLAFFASFAVKVPMWPVHTWLPDAHVEAPTAGSVILAGVLLKMGGYGFLRFSLPIFPDATHFFTPLVFTLSIIAIIYTSLVAFAQTDIKKLIAYSSVAHMGYVTLGIFTLNVQGISGAIVQMISHGIVSAALFLCVGVIYDRMHTREIKFYGGLATRMPNYAFVFMVFILASVGLPGTSGFVGEFLVILGAFEANTWAGVLACTGMVLGATYALWLYRRVVYGKLENKALADIEDLNVREMSVFAPLVLLVVFLGVYPKPILKVVEPSVVQLVQQYEKASVRFGLEPVDDEALDEEG